MKKMNKHHSTDENSKLCLFIAIIFPFIGITETILANLGFNISSRSISWILVSSCLIPVLFLIRSQHQPLSAYGITFENWKISLIRGIVITTILLLAFYYLINKYSIALNLQYLSDPFLFTYFIQSYLQEFMFRGVLQKLYISLLGHKPIAGIILTSLAFSFFHIGLSTPVILLTFALGLLLGYLYYQDKNLIGVSIIHFSLGVIAMMLSMLQ